MRTVILLAAGLWSFGAPLAQTVPYRLHGQAWVDAGRIMQSTDSTQSDGANMNLNDTWLQSTGAQMTVSADLGDNWEGTFGFGAHRVSHAVGTYGGSETPHFLAITLYKSFVTEARVTWFQGEKNAPDLSFTLGSFVHNYNPDAKNLGLYLLRGPVYPGLLVGGYGDFSADTTKSNVLGVRVQQSLGAFSHSLILKNERELPPTFDWSLAYVAKYRVFDALEIGGGVNFHRIVPHDRDLMKPGKIMRDDLSMYEVDTTGAGGDPARYDTTFFSHQGVKLMALFSLDLKRWVALPRAASRDLRLYGEAAVIGVKNYGETYGDVLERIPVMMGFNFPTFGVLDLLSLEVEWYGSPYRNDLAYLGNPAGIVADWTRQQRPTPSPGPVTGDYPNADRDDWKWTLYLEKVVAQHVCLTAQIANDHYRPRPMATGMIEAAGGTAEAFTTPKDWYFTFRLGYFF